MDIKRAKRIQHIRALKEKSDHIEQVTTGDNEILHFKLYSIEDMPELPPLDPGALSATEIATANTPQNRLTRWKGKLLDLTLRNKLLNFKPGKTFLKIVCADLKTSRRCLK